MPKRRRHSESNRNAAAGPAVPSASRRVTRRSVAQHALRDMVNTAADVNEAPAPGPRLYGDLLLSHVLGFLSFHDIIMVDRTCKTWEAVVRSRSSIGATFEAGVGRRSPVLGAMVASASPLPRHIACINGGSMGCTELESLASRLPRLHSLQGTEIYCVPHGTFAPPMQLRSLALRVTRQLHHDLDKSMFQRLIDAVATLRQLEDLRLVLGPNRGRPDYNLQLAPLVHLTSCHTLYFSWGGWSMRLSDRQQDAIVAMPALRHLALLGRDLISMKLATVPAGFLPRLAASPLALRLRTIGLSYWEPTPSDYIALSQLPTMTALEGESTDATDLTWLPSLRSLVTLHVPFPKTDPEAYAMTLARLSQLKDLSIRHERMTDSQLSLVVESLSELTSLQLYWMRQLRSTDFLRNAACPARLTKLSICCCIGLLSKVEDFLPLHELTELRSLNISGSTGESLPREIERRYTGPEAREIWPKLTQWGRSG